MVGTPLVFLQVSAPHAAVRVRPSSSHLPLATAIRARRCVACFLQRIIACLSPPLPRGRGPAVATGQTDTKPSTRPCCGTSGVRFLRSNFPVYDTFVVLADFIPIPTSCHTFFSVLDCVQDFVLLERVHCPSK